MEIIDTQHRLVAAASPPPGCATVTTTAAMDLMRFRNPAAPSPVPRDTSSAVGPDASPRATSATRITTVGMVWTRRWIALALRTRLHVGQR